MFSTFLYRIDLFGVPVSMNFYGKPKSTSSLGGICSLLFFGFSVWAIYNSSKDLFSQTNPKTIRSDSFNNDPPEIVISAENFPLAFQVESSTAGIFFDDSIYNFKMIHVLNNKIMHGNGTIEETQIQTNIRTEKCTAEHFGELASSYSSVISSKSLCIALNQPELNEITVQGVYGSLVSRNLIIQISLCKNDTSSSNCSSQEKITSYLSGAWFRVIYPNMVINTENFKDPDSKFQDSYAGVINPVNYRQMQIGLGHIEVVDDVGWLTESIHTKKFIKVNSADSTVQPKPQNSNVVLTCNFAGNKLANRYSRRYKKIQDVLAEVGGLVNTVLVIIFLVTSPYVRFKYREALMNEFFDLDICASTTKKRGNQVKENTFSMSEDIKFDLSKTQNNTNLPTTRTNGLRFLENTNSMQVVEEKEISQSFLSPKREIKPLSLTEIAGLRTSCVENPPSSSRRELTQKCSPRTNNFSSSPHLQKTTKKNIISKLPENAKKKATVKPHPKVLIEPEDESPDVTFCLSPVAADETSQAESQRTSQDKLEQIALGLQTNNKNSSVYLDMKDNQKNTYCIEHNQNKRESVFARAKKKEKESPNFKPVRCELGAWEYICSFFCYKPKYLQKKIEIINEGIKHVNMKLDFVNILKKIRELEKLTGLLLDGDQLLVFNGLPKPQITMVDDIEGKSEAKDKPLRKTAFSKIPKAEVQVLKAYERLLLKEKKTKIDEKLIKLFEDTNY